MEELVQIFTVQTNIYLMFLASFIGGVVASISPCSLSILPLIIGYVGGYSEQKPLKIFVQMIFFCNRFGACIFSYRSIILRIDRQDICRKSLFCLNHRICYFDYGFEFGPDY